jgi:hypothetical protein
MPEQQQHLEDVLESLSSVEEALTGLLESARSIESWAEDARRSATTARDAAEQREAEAFLEALEELLGNTPLGAMIELTESLSDAVRGLDFVIDSAVIEILIEEDSEVSD